MKRFIVGRIKSLYFAIKGMFLLLFSEDAIKTHTITALLLIAMGIYFGLTQVQWIVQILLIGLVFVAESLNTAIEKICDFVHPNYHQEIGFIKDISAGAVSFAVFVSTIGNVILYYRYVEDFIYKLIW